MSEVADVEEEPERSDLELAIEWAQVPDGRPCTEEGLPVALSRALADQRSADTQHTYGCLAYRTLVDGKETSRVGPTVKLPNDQELVSIAVIQSSVSSDGIRVTAHTLVAVVTGD